MVHNVSPLIIILPPQSKDLPPASSIGRKSYMPIDKFDLYSRARVEKKKIYEVTKPQTIS
jgi:hypothetical protein